LRAGVSSTPIISSTSLPLIFLISLNFFPLILSKSKSTAAIEMAHPPPSNFISVITPFFISAEIKSLSPQSKLASLASIPLIFPLFFGF